MIEPSTELMSRQGKRGLHCRADEGHCERYFIPVVDTVDGIQAAAGERNAHEEALHGYFHKPIPLDQWSFSESGQKARPLHRWTPTSFGSTARVIP